MKVGGELTATWTSAASTAAVVCRSFQPPVLTLSFGVRELCKASLAKGGTVPHLQHAVPHHLREQGGPEVVEHLALLVGVRRPLDQLLEVLLDHGGALRRLHRAFLLAEGGKVSRLIHFQFQA